MTIMEASPGSDARQILRDEMLQRLRFAMAGAGDDAMMLEAGVLRDQTDQGIAKISASGVPPRYICTRVSGEASFCLCAGLKLSFGFACHSRSLKPEALSRFSQSRLLRG